MCPFRYTFFDLLRPPGFIQLFKLTFLTGWARLPFSDMTAAPEDFLDDEQLDERLDLRDPLDWFVSAPEVTMPAAAPSSWICRKISACSAAAPPALGLGLVILLALSQNVS